jgi:hypothetical protein
MLVCVRK